MHQGPAATNPPVRVFIRLLLALLHLFHQDLLDDLLLLDEESPDNAFTDAACAARAAVGARYTLFVGVGVLVLGGAVVLDLQEISRYYCVLRSTVGGAALTPGRTVPQSPQREPVARFLR